MPENEIKVSETQKAYSYLGIEENHCVEHRKRIEERVCKKFKIDYEYRAECNK
jgi:hypothetical protein